MARATPAALRRPSPREFACALALALLLGTCGPAAADGLTIGGTGAALGSMQLLAGEFTARNPDIPIVIVPSLGSGGGIKAVLAGAIGLAVTSRPLNDGERRQGAAEIEYARTPFVFAVPVESRVAAITVRELADIYSGRMATWADGTPVRIVLRPESDIDTEMVMNLSPDIRRGVLAAHGRPGVRLSVNDQDAAGDIERIPGAIGPTTLALIVSEKRALRALKLDGKEPTAANLASGAYPYFKRLYLVTGARPTAPAGRFIAFVQSPEGRRILAGNAQWSP